MNVDSRRRMQDPRFRYRSATAASGWAVADWRADTAGPTIPAPFEGCNLLSLVQWPAAGPLQQVLQNTPRNPLSLEGEGVSTRRFAVYYPILIRLAERGCDRGLLKRPSTREMLTERVQMPPVCHRDVRHWATLGRFVGKPSLNVDYQ